MPHANALGRRLIRAAKKGYYSTISTLLTRGVDCNYKNGDQNTALHWAACNGHSDCCRALIDAKADVFGFNRYGRDVLNYAAFSGMEWLVVHCLEQGADPCKMDNFENSAVMFAINGGHLNILRTILDHGISVNYLDKNNESFMCYAAWSGQVEILAELHARDAKTLNQRNNRGITPLIHAAHKGNLSCVKFLAEHGADINHVSGDKCSALMHAVAQSHHDVAEYLIRAGANVNVEDEHGRSPLMWAAYTAQIGTVRALLERGANARHIDNYGGTVLQYQIPPEIRRMIEDSLVIRLQEPHMNQDVEVCAVCYEPCKKEFGARLSCSHQFHAYCLLKWTLRQRTCPMCRASVSAT